jgi:hypothetical protein
VLLRSRIHPFNSKRFTIGFATTSEGVRYSWE